VGPFPDAKVPASLIHRVRGIKNKRDFLDGVVHLAHGMHGLLRDIRFALRMFRFEPAFAFVAVIVLAIGTGANAARRYTGCAFA
jgi:hypothetical protein